MPRNKTLLMYNGTKDGTNQGWTVVGGTVINKAYTIGKTRESVIIQLKADVTITFTVDATITLTATYDYGNDSWTSATDTPEQITFEVRDSGLIVTCNYNPLGSESHT